MAATTVFSFRSAFFFPCAALNVEIRAYIRGARMPFFVRLISVNCVRSVNGAPRVFRYFLAARFRFAEFASRGTRRTRRELNSKIMSRPGAPKSNSPITRRLSTRPSPLLSSFGDCRSFFGRDSTRRTTRPIAEDLANPPRDGAN